MMIVSVLVVGHGICTGSVSTAIHELVHAGDTLSLDLIDRLTRIETLNVAKRFLHVGGLDLNKEIIQRANHASHHFAMGFCRELFDCNTLAICLSRPNNSKGRRYVDGT